MKTAHQFVLVVILSLVLAAILLAPGREEHVAVLAGEGRYTEAIALLEQRLAKEPGNPGLLAALGRSYAAIGEIDRAIEAFDAYLARRPSDLAARKRQAELLRQRGLVDRYLEAKARIVRAEPSRGEISRLVELYRLYGRPDDELATLRTYAKKAMLQPAQLERLGAILAARTDWDEAQHWLEVADHAAPPEASTGRFLLLEVLIHKRATDEAGQRAQSWMLAWRSPFLAGRLVLRLARAGLAAQASELALRSVDMMPDDTFEMVSLFAGKGQLYLARCMLARWADRTAEANTERLRAFVRASAQASDIHEPLLKLARLVQHGSKPAVQAELAEALADAFGTAGLDAVRPLLSKEALLARPLFAAELSMGDGNREMARWFLRRTDPVRLSPEQLETWFALLQRVETDADLFRHLTLLWKDGRLPVQLLPPFAEEARKLGQVGMHDMIWSAMNR